MKKESCPVCGREVGNTRCYGILSCEACKQFFRRTVAERKHYKCAEKGRCDTTKNKCCRSCRLQKCVVVGMEPRMVSVQHSVAQDKYFEELEELRQTAVVDHQSGKGPSSSLPNCSEGAECSYPEDCSNSTDIPLALVPLGLPPQDFQQSALDSSVVQMPPPPGHFSLQLGAQWAELSRTLASLGGVELKFQQLFAEERAFKPGFVDQFGTLADVLKFGHSIIDNIGKFTFPMQTESVVCGSKITWGYHRNVLQMELFPYVDLFRSLPFFNLLHTEDQVRLVNFVGVALGSFCAKYHSARLNSEVELKMPWNITPILEYRTSERYRNNTTVQHLADVLHRRALEPFNKAKMCEQEFLLLRAVLCSYPHVPNLSPYAQQLLQQESERYASVLMRLEQSRLGHQAGAMRYAEVLHLVECAFWSAERVRQLLSYLAMVLDQDRFHDFTPRPFLPMMLNGVDL